MSEFNPVTQDRLGDPKNPASMSPVFFETGGSKIFGTMFIASGIGPHPVILLLHGFPGNEANFDLAHAFHRQGFCVMVFHYRGCWGSEGDYKWKHLLEDTNEASKFLKSDFAVKKFRIDKNKIIIGGHSMGGFTALYTSVFHDEIKNVFSIAGFNCGAFAQILDSNKIIFDYSVQTIEYAVQFVNNSSAESLIKEYIENKKEWDLLNHLDKLAKKNILLIGAKYDMIAPLDIHHNSMVEKLKSKMVNAKGKMEDHILETGHSLSDKRIELTEIISKWLSKIKFE